MKASDVEIGKVYGNAKILRNLGVGKNRYYNFEAECQVCGRIYTITSAKIGETQFCGKCKTWYKANEILGRRFGSLVVLERVDPHRACHQLYWRCQCDCGNIDVVTSNSLLSGKRTSCMACLYKGIGAKNSRKAMIKHMEASGGKFTYCRLKDHPNRYCWESMINRCTRSDNHNYPNYGGRGIKVCDRWTGKDGFIRFVEDMGTRPSAHHSLDRIDVNGDYEPSNCRWATVEEQSNNKQDSVFVYIRENRLTVSQFKRKFSIRRSLDSMHSLIRKGFDINYIISIDAKYSPKDNKPHEEIYRNHNRVVSEEVAKLLEEKQAI